MMADAPQMPSLPPQHPVMPRPPSGATIRKLALPCLHCMGSACTKQLRNIKAAIFQHYPAEKNPKRHLLERAFREAHYFHRHQRRKSGEPYIFHPARVALQCAEAGLDVETAIVALLHDLIEDTELTQEKMAARYGNWIAAVVDGLTKVESAKKPQRSAVPQQNASFATYRKLLSSTALDFRTLLVKIMDRRDNLYDLGCLSRHKQKRICTETLNIYVPLARRMGMKTIADEFQLYCFQYQYPKRFAKTCELWKEQMAHIWPQLSSRFTLIQSLLSRAELPEASYVRPILKGIEEWIHHKHITPQQVANELCKGYQVVTATTKGCYGIMGALHMRFRVESKTIRDYISNPQPNHYQALHTQVFISKISTAIQIVSQEMVKNNQIGILSGWEGSQTEMQQYYHSYVELLEQYEDAHEYLRMEDVLSHARMSELQLFTPKGDMIFLPRGATVLDFAFAIHTEVGGECQGGVINGEQVSVFTKLNDGEVVTIIRDAVVQPTREWYDYVQTNRARLAISKLLKAQANQRAQEIGKNLLAQMLKQSPEHPSWEQDTAFKTALQAEKLTLLQFYQRITCQQINLSQFLNVHQLYKPLLPALQVNGEQAVHSGMSTVMLAEAGRSAEESAVQAQVLVVNGSQDPYLHLCSVCAPLIGEAIIGWRNKDNTGITIHRASQSSCLSKAEKPLSLAVMWHEQMIKNLIQFSLQLKHDDNQDYLLWLIELVAELKLHITHLSMAESAQSGFDTLKFKLRSESYDTMSQFAARLRQQQGLKHASIL